MSSADITFDEIMSYAPGNHNRDVYEWIKKQIKKNSVIPFVGAGLSCLFYPLWSDALREMAESIADDTNREKVLGGIENDTIRTAQELEEILGRRRLQQQIINIFNISKYNERKSEVIGSAVNVLPYLFPDSPIITTNFDQILEKIYAERGYSFDDVVLPESKVILEMMRTAGGHGLFHLHGKVSGTMIDYNNIVFTQSQYDDHYNEESPLVAQLIEWFTGKMMLFLGCSLNQDMTLQILKTVSSDGLNHFAIIECEKTNIDDRLRDLGDDYGIHAIVYPKGQHESVRIVLEHFLNDLDPIKYEYYCNTIPDERGEILKDDPTRFHYDAGNIKFIGREKEITELKDFCGFNTSTLKKDNGFCWWAITGLGGSGKSRLVYEFGESLKKTGNWAVQRLVASDYRNLSKISDGFAGNVLVVADYAGTHTNELGEWIEELSNRPYWTGHIRLLLIERDNGRKEVEQNKYQEITGTIKDKKMPFWYDMLADHIGMNATLSSSQKYPKDFLKLHEMDEESIKSIMKSYAEFQENPSVDIDSLYQVLKKLDGDLCRPLYALFIVDSACQGENPEFMTGIEILEQVIRREKNIYHHYISNVNSGKENRILVNLLDRIRGIATIYEDITVEDFKKFFPSLWGKLEEIVNNSETLDPSIYTPEELLKKCNVLGERNYIEAIRPDIMGEYYVIETIINRENIEDIFFSQWADRLTLLRPFLERIINDYKANLSEQFWDGLLCMDVYTLDEIKSIDYAAILFMCTENPPDEISDKAFELIEIIYKRYPDNKQIGIIYARCLVDISYNASSEEIETLIKKMKVLYDKYSVDKTVREKLAISLVNLTYEATPDVGEAALKELRKIYNKYPQDDKVRELFAECLFNVSNNEGTEKKYILLEELRKLFKNNSEDSNVRRIFAEGLFNGLIHSTPENSGLMIEELKELSESYPDDDEVLEIFRKCTGPNSIFTVRNEEVIRVEGSYYDLLLSCRIVLENTINEYGENHIDTAVAYNNLALSLNEAGCFYEALECCKKAISIYENIPEKDNLNIAISYDNLGLIYDSMGKYKEAIDARLKAMELFDNTKEENSLDLSIIYNGIGLTYSHIGNIEEALKYYNLALDIRKRKLGNNDSFTRKVYDNIVALNIN